MTAKPCGHCGKPLPEVLGRPWQRYCSRRCKKNARELRRYHRRKDEHSPTYTRMMDKNVQLAREWRERKAAQGLCHRCGCDNDRAELGLVICTNCMIDIKG